MKNIVALVPAETGDLPAFKTELQNAFAIAVIEEFGALPDGPIPSERDLDESISAPGAEVLHVVRDGQRIGGAVVTIDRKTHRNSLDLLFLSQTVHGHGLGLNAWRAIEQRYPDTRIWITHTPYFEKRNIHFYVNKCGFKIVEFFCATHPDHDRRSPNDLPGGGEAFRFEKTM